MNHWFDRLAVRAAGAHDEQSLTRRQVVKSAAAGAVAVGGLGSPLVSMAFGLTPCECQERAKQKALRDMKSAVNHYYLGGQLLRPTNVALWIAETLGTQLEFFGTLTSCGKCDEDPRVGKAPPPKDQPCLSRGGVALRDQCGGSPPPSSGSQCAQGTHLCSDGLCCFGSDLCCANCAGGPQCCIAEIGCTCC